jgi:hypothetical protein
MSGFKKFFVVEYLDMPQKIRDALIEFDKHDNHIRNGTYLPFANWGNTTEGSIPAALVVEAWIESHVPELHGLRSREQEPYIPVLIHTCW